MATSKSASMSVSTIIALRLLVLLLMPLAPLMSAVHAESSVTSDELDWPPTPTPSAEQQKTALLLKSWHAQYETFGFYTGGEACQTQPVGELCIAELDHAAAQQEPKYTGSPDYWESYFELTQGSAFALSITLDEDYSGANTSLITAPRRWLAHEYLNNGQLRGNQLALLLREHRRLVMKATSLVDAMVFTAALGIYQSHINTYMALKARQPEIDLATDSDLDAMLRVVSPQELSFRSVFQGEYPHVLKNLDDPVMLGEEGVDGSPGAREVLVAGIPAGPAPASWRWDWVTNDGSGGSGPALCLEPVDVHHSLKVVRLCERFLSAL